MVKEILRLTNTLPEDSNCIMNEWRGVWMASHLPVRASSRDSSSSIPTSSSYPLWFNWSKELPGCSQLEQIGHRLVRVLSFYNNY